MFPDVSIVELAREHHAALPREADLYRLAQRAREAPTRSPRVAEPLLAPGASPLGRVAPRVVPMPIRTILER